MRASCSRFRPVISQSTHTMRSVRERADPSVAAVVVPSVMADMLGGHIGTPNG
jgi:hypothetical protein